MKPYKIILDKLYRGWIIGSAFAGSMTGGYHGCHYQKHDHQRSSAVRFVTDLTNTSIGMITGTICGAGAGVVSPLLIPALPVTGLMYAYDRAVREETENENRQD